MNEPSQQRPTTIFDVVGGFPFFFALVDRFYEGVEGDDAIRPLYPEDLGPGKEALALFLGQYWGGPATYSETKGHPRLRMRHAPFAIGPAERDAWLRHMTAAVETADDLHPDIATAMHEYFAKAAEHMINQPS